MTTDHLDIPTVWNEYLGPAAVPALKPTLDVLTEALDELEQTRNALATASGRLDQLTAPVEVLDLHQAADQIESGELSPWQQDPPTDPPHVHAGAPAAPDAGTGEGTGAPEAHSGDLDLGAIEARAAGAHPQQLRVAGAWLPDAPIRPHVLAAIEDACHVTEFDVPELASEVRRLQGEVAGLSRDWAAARAQVRRLQGERLTAPAELDLDAISDGATGWDRAWIAQLPGHLPSTTYLAPDLAGRAQREIAALLADVDRLVSEVRRLTVDDWARSAGSGPEQPEPAPEAHSGILGRGLLDKDGDLWPNVNGDQWRSPAGRRSLARSREFAESWNGPVREVLLVEPEAARVLETAREWAATTDWAGPVARYVRHTQAERELVAAVDALDGDQPAAPGTEPDGAAGGDPADAPQPWRCVRCGSTKWVGWRRGPEHEGWPRRAQCVPCGRIQDAPRTEQAPADPDSDDGPGWSRRTILALLERDAADATDDELLQISALLADRDLLRQQLDHALDELDHHREITAEATAALPSGDPTLPIGEQVRQALDTAHTAAVTRAEAAESRLDGQAWQELQDEVTQLRRQLAAREARPVWDDTIAPGGNVCPTCRTPTESEPCDCPEPA